MMNVESNLEDGTPKTVKTLVYARARVVTMNNDDYHGRSYHRVRGARAPPVSGLEFLKRSSQGEIYKLNGVGHLRFPNSTSHV